MKNKKIAAVLFLSAILWFIPGFVVSKELPQSERVEQFLASKHSPLASHVDVLMAQPHWKLIIAISAIESQYCKESIGNNCWGIKDGAGDGYRKYQNLDKAIPDVERLLAFRQSKGQWLTVESMDGSYVVPKNPNWVYTVNWVLNKLNAS